MKILKAKYLLTFDENFKVIKDGAVVFDENILEVATYSFIKRKYAHLEVVDLGANSVLMPGLINSHLQLEFSANKTTLKYGNLYDWLNSVIK